MVPSPFNAEQQARFDAELDAALARFPPERSQAALLPALHAAQKELGWLSPDTLAYVASRLKLWSQRVHEVAAFYTLFHRKPVGKNHLQICTNLSCALAGGEKLLEQACQRVGARPHEVSADGQFSVEPVSCLASCGTAPAMQVNDRYYNENMSAEKLDALIEELARHG